MSDMSWGEGRMQIVVEEKGVHSDGVQTQAQDSNQAKSMWTNPLPIKKAWFNAQDLIQFLSEFWLWNDWLKLVDRSQTNERMRLCKIFF